VRENPEYPGEAQEGLEAIRVRPVVGKQYRFEEAPVALRDLAERKVIGKAVLIL
jgi:NADPH:quinone reductase-like Zn-dependent oxidoreductase